MSGFPFAVVPYEDIYSEWPEEGRHIIASYDNDTIVVYQPCSTAVALFASTFQSFKKNQGKVVWGLRPSFLAACFAAGWGKKPGFESLLAITMSRMGFEALLRAAVRMVAHQSPESHFEWGHDLDLFGEELARSELRVSVKKQILDHFLKNWIIRISDVTGFMVAQAENLSEENVENLLVPEEKLYRLLDPNLGKFIEIDTVELDPQAPIDDQQSQETNH